MTSSNSLDRFTKLVCFPISLICFGMLQITSAQQSEELSSDDVDTNNVERRIHLDRMEQVMGVLPSLESRDAPSFTILSREEMDGYKRLKITYVVDDEDPVPAWLLVPHGEGPFPAILCLHQTINIGKDETVGLGVQDSKRQAYDLVQQGFVCLAPDYPTFGEYDYDLDAAIASGRYTSGTMKAIWNNIRGVDLLCAWPSVDAERLGIIGHSLGGHNALFTAAFDERLKVAVSSCGFCSFENYYGGNLKGWTSLRYMPLIASRYESSPSKIPFDFDDVLLAIYPRAIFAMSPLHDENFDVEGVKKVLEKVAPTYQQSGLSHKLQAAHPDAGHEWPLAERQAAYEFIQSSLSR